MKKLLLIFITIMTMLVSSCASDNGDNNSDNPLEPAEKNYKIIVVDENNQAIANALITDGTNTITTSTSGIATFESPNETYGKYRFAISKDGYFPGSLNLVKFANPDNDYTVMLIASDTTITVPDTGGTETGTDWTFTSTGGFTYDNGTAVTGNVDISIRYINPYDFESTRNAFPGQDFTAVSGGNDDWLYIYGWVAISYSYNGVRVYPAAGSVTIQVQVPGEYANAAQNGGKVFYYDDNAGVWEESANPTVTGLDVTMPLPSQTTFCALGKKEPTSTIMYKKNTCMPGYSPDVDAADYGYFVQVELDFDRLDNYINSLPGHHITLWHMYNRNSSYGADQYPSGYALGNNPLILANAGSNGSGAFQLIFDYLGFENETFTFPTAYDGGFKIHSIRMDLREGHENDPLSDKVIKEYASFPVGVTNLGILNTVCEGTIPNPHDSATTTGSGQLTYNGQTVNGTCTATPAQVPGCKGIDVLLYGGGESFLIRNMPTASTGTFTVNGDGTNCNSDAITLFGGASQSTSGSITKTGAKSFTFTITMENLSTGATNVATGSGSYD